MTTEQNHDETIQRLRDALTHRAESVAAPSSDPDGVAGRAREAASPRRWQRRPLVTAAAFGLTLVTGAAAGATLLPEQPMRGQGSPFNPGGALHCTGIELMTPSDAKVQLEERGYEVVWNYFAESNDDAPTYDQPPDTALVTDVLLLDNRGEALIVAEGYRPGDIVHERLVAGETLCEEPPLPGRSDVAEQP